MTIREALPNRNITVVIKKVTDVHNISDLVSFNHISDLVSFKHDYKRTGKEEFEYGHILDKEYLSVIPLQKKYIFYVRSFD